MGLRSVSTPNVWGAFPQAFSRGLRGNLALRAQVQLPSDRPAGSQRKPQLRPGTAARAANHARSEEGGGAGRAIRAPYQPESRVLVGFELGSGGRIAVHGLAEVRPGSYSAGVASMGRRGGCSTRLGRRGRGEARLRAPWSPCRHPWSGRSRQRRTNPARCRRTAARDSPRMLRARPGTPAVLRASARAVGRAAQAAGVARCASAPPYRSPHRSHYCSLRNEQWLRWRRSPDG